MVANATREAYAGPEGVDGGPTVLRQRATFAPRGLAGHAYWWAIAGFHGIVFGGMIRGVTRAAEQAGVSSAETQ